MYGPELSIPAAFATPAKTPAPFPVEPGKSADRASIAKNVMDVANGPGTKIYPGELKKGLDLLAKGKKVDYEGATGVTFTSVGEAEGSFLEQEVKGGKFKTKKQR